MRRLAFGANSTELDGLEKAGIHAAIDGLLAPADDGFDVSPWEFMFNRDGNVDMNPARAAGWWALRMACSKTPSREKMTLFWHDHFAVSASKVENGPMMVQYVETLRKHAFGNFRSLLGAITKNPAMLRWLDTDLSIKGRPNENFAREVLELFTVGIGNYSEKDIQELARAFTGWGLRSTYRGGTPAQNRAQIEDSMAMDRPLIASSYSEDLHDEGPKTVLGKTSDFDTESALDMLASRPETARYLSTKLWEFCAYPKPEPKVVERLMKAYFDGKYEIRSVLRAIVTSKEFWSDRAVRAIVKSPADLVVGVIRNIGLGDLARGARQPGTPPTKPIEGPLAGLAELVGAPMRRQGMRLLYPPDVAGWDWGDAWVSPAMMAERIRFADILVGPRRGVAILNLIHTKVMERVPASPDAALDAIAGLLDADIPADRRPTFLEAVHKGGGVDALRNQRTCGDVIRPVMKLIFGMPEFQLC
jgi:uncharacterized protein (DUF1800 family)